MVSQIFEHQEVCHAVSIFQHICTIEPVTLLSRVRQLMRGTDFPSSGSGSLSLFARWQLCSDAAGAR